MRWSGRCGAGGGRKDCSDKACGTEGLEYQPLFDFQTADKKAVRGLRPVRDARREGSGIGAWRSAFGEDDARVHENGLPFVQGRTSAGFRSGTPWAGMFVKEADQYITQALEGAGLLLKSLRYTHSYRFGQATRRFCTTRARRGSSA